MQQIRQAVRLLILWMATGCVLAVATNAALFAHLYANTARTSCTHAGDHDEEPLNSHHSESCHICHVLLGPASKYLCVAPTMVGFEIEPTQFVCQCQSNCIYQHSITPFSARGPPAC